MTPSLIEQPAPTVADMEDALFVHISDIGSYDVLLCRSSTSPSSFEIGPSSSHVGNARFDIMLSMWSNGCGDDSSIATSIIRTLCEECNGRILLPMEDIGSDGGPYFRDIGSTPDAIEVVKNALAAMMSPLASFASPTPSTPAGEPSSPICAKRRRRRSSVVHFNIRNADVSSSTGSSSVATRSSNSNNNSKRRRRSSLKPSSYGAGAMGPDDVAASPSSTSVSSVRPERVHFAVPVAPADVTSADVVLPTIHEATSLNPHSGVGNNRLRVMLQMVSSRYFEAVSSGNDDGARSIAKELVRQAHDHRDGEGNRGRFLDIASYDENDNEQEKDGAVMYVEVPHDVAIGAVCSFLDEAAGIRTPIIPATKAAPTASDQRRKRSSSGKNNTKKERPPSKKMMSSAKLLHGVPIPAHLMPSNIASLRRGAAEDMRKKKAKKVTCRSGRTIHGGAKGFSSTLCGFQIAQMQEMFRSMAKEGGVGSNAEAKNPDSTSTATDVSFRGIPNLKQSQARAA